MTSTNSMHSCRFVYSRFLVLYFQTGTLVYGSGDPSKNDPTVTLRFVI